MIVIDHEILAGLLFIAVIVVCMFVVYHEDKLGGVLAWIYASAFWGAIALVAVAVVAVILFG